MTFLGKRYNMKYSLSFIIIKYVVMQKTTGLLLLIIGAVMLIWTGFSYTKREKIVDAGPIQISADKQKSVNWPPYAGGILAVCGIIVLVTSKKDK
jgi:hypothetical protein